jgi:hypothetical protein
MSDGRKHTSNLNLYEHIEYEQPDDLSADSVADILERLHLPEPRGNEYYITNDYGYLMFMTFQGCAIRITNNSRCPPLEHSRILKPLVRFDLGEHRIDLNPGLKLTQSISSVVRMISALAKDDIDFSDPAPRNCGIIPAECTGFRFNYTVVCDDGAVDKMPDRKFGLLKKIHSMIAVNDNNNDVQVRAYQSLRDAFHTAIRSEKPEDMMAAWKLCRAEQLKGRLCADWVKPPENAPKIIKSIAAKYAQRLRHLPT